MEKFTKLTGIAAPMPLVNIDTDMIIPKQFLKTIKRTGLGKSLFFEMRYTQDGKELSDFVLNKPAYRKAEILVAGDNFGCGSSREHAPWALLDFGIRCVISTSCASCGRSRMAASAGESVSELKAEITVEIAMVSANCWYIRPVRPPMMAQSPTCTWPPSCTELARMVWLPTWLWSPSWATATAHTSFSPTDDVRLEPAM